VSRLARGVATDNAIGRILVTPEKLDYQERYRSLPYVATLVTP
jgi:hypothetical protein